MRPLQDDDLRRQPGDDPSQIVEVIRRLDLEPARDRLRQFVDVADAAYQLPASHDDVVRQLRLEAVQKRRLAAALGPHHGGARRKSAAPAIGDLVERAQRVLAPHEQLPRPQRRRREEATVDRGQPAHALVEVRFVVEIREGAKGLAGANVDAEHPGDPQRRVLRSEVSPPRDSLEHLVQPSQATHLPHALDREPVGEAPTGPAEPDRHLLGRLDVLAHLVENGALRLRHLPK